MSLLLDFSIHFYFSQNNGKMLYVLGSYSEVSMSFQLRNDDFFIKKISAILILNMYDVGKSFVPLNFLKLSILFCFKKFLWGYGVRRYDVEQALLRVKNLIFLDSYLVLDWCGMSFCVYIYGFSWLMIKADLANDLAK